MSPSGTLSKEGDDSIKPELNHVQSITRGTCTYGDLDLQPRSQKYTAQKKSSEKSSSKECDYTDDIRSSLAELIRISFKQLQAQV